MNAMYVFANAIDYDAPTQSADTVKYIGPGGGFSFPRILYNLARNNEFDYSKACSELGYTTRPYQETIHDEVQWLLAKGLFEEKEHAARGMGEIPFPGDCCLSLTIKAAVSSLGVCNSAVCTLRRE